MTTEPTMQELIEIYPTRRKVSAQYYRQLCSKVGAFIKHCQNQTIRPADITPAHQQAFIDTLNSKGLRPETVRGYHRAIVAVRNFAKELEIGKVYLPKVIQRVTEGFTIKELKKQLKYAKSLKGVLSNGVKEKHFWLGAINAGFSTGLRAGDMFQVASGDIPDDGLLDIVQNKTGKLVRVRFNEEAIKWVRKHGQPEAFPWPHTFTWFERCYNKLLRACGVNRGTWKWLRRSAGSYADENGNGHELLGNTRAVFEQHYRVQEIAAKEPPSQTVI